MNTSTAILQITSKIFQNWIPQIFLKQLRNFMETYQIYNFVLALSLFFQRNI